MRYPLESSATGAGLIRAAACPDCGGRPTRPGELPRWLFFSQLLEDLNEGAHMTDRSWDIEGDFADRADRERLNDYLLQFGWGNFVLGHHPSLGESRFVARGLTVIMGKPAKDRWEAELRENARVLGFPSPRAAIVPSEN